MSTGFAGARERREDDPVAALYAAKTRSILAKYGPGPRVHYHTGLVGSPAPEGPGAESLDVLRVRITSAQERLCTTVLDGARHVPLRGRVLDVGCGLGGPALLVAARRQVEHVTAITNQPEHVARVRDFAAALGLAEKVRVEARDAHEPPTGPFDAAVAIESSCYFDRARWLRALAPTLAPDGGLHVVDCMLGERGEQPWFDARWQTRIGTPAEYERAAQAAGLEVAARTNLAERAAPFWELSVRWTLEHEPPGPERDERVRAHLRLRQALESGAIQYIWMEIIRTR